MEKYDFNAFMDIIRRLRGEGGCPWDREQTHESLKSALLEECYEVIEAINNKDMKNLCEELGDVLLQVAMHSAIAEETGVFTVDDVISRVSGKMVYRHPHVFGDITVSGSEEVLKNWDEIKKKEKKQEGPIQELQDIPKALPANIRAYKVQKKAGKAGLTLSTGEQTLLQIYEGLDELKNAMEQKDSSQVEGKYGNTLFLLIKLSLILQINAENSLTNATNKFINRLIDILSINGGKDQSLCGLTSAEQDALWRNLK